jgi:hypothetical protein
MEVNYVPQGEKGRTCADCKNFEAEIKSQGVGKCFGKEVAAGGSCNFFEAKKTAR